MSASLTCGVTAGGMPKTGPPIACVAAAGESIGMGGPGPPRVAPVAALAV